MPQFSRRQFVLGSAAALGALSSTGRSLLWAAPRKKLPKPDKSGIQHVVVVMMENRSFDHLLGWLPGADGRQAGLVYTDSQGVTHPTYPLAPDYQGCGHPDPDHSYEGGRIEYDGGACDGWLRAGANDIYSIGYYTQKDLPFLGKAAPDWTVCSRYFAPIMAPTYPNRIYQHSAVTDRLDDSLGPCALPTIWDRLAEAGLRGRYYFNDIPFLGLWGPKYGPITRRYDQFLQDCAAGTLPEVSFVDPPFYGEDAGTSSDDHPHGDIRAGESWLYRTYRAVTTGRAWNSTVMVINFDEWGGFFEHIAPEEAPDVNPAFALRGFRVPCVIVSPFSAPGAIAQDTYDHTSVLKMIEWRFNLPPLSVRDAAANNLAEALDFKLHHRSAPDYVVPPFVSAACPA
ncbi:MAG TPA: alkaline phosphatase family protein [Thermoanaerobaculia bacterium]|jgi:phospholipase C|nr:alkaline phosphatase family protein [Thermoanaerobaculia bacterium]